KGIFIAARPQDIWDAARDVGALHTRLVPGFVVDTKVDGDVRTVTFGSGAVAREPILSVDDERRRLAWTTEGGGMTHYNAVLQVIAEGDGTHVLWTSDVLPHGAAEKLGEMQEKGLAIMKKTFEQRR